MIFGYSTTVLLSRDQAAPHVAEEPRHLCARLETFKQRCSETFSWQRVARSLLAAASSLVGTARSGAIVGE